MANDLSVLSTIKSDLALRDGGVDEDTRAVAGGSNYRRISIEGRVFRKFVNGKEVAKVPDTSMNVIFVKMAHTASRTYYAGAYKKGIKASPVCWSSDAKVPDAKVKTPQSASCDSCPMSIKGTGQGGIGSACRLSWRTAVVLPGDVGGDVMQLVLPATSCFGKEENGRWPFRPYIQMLANNNISAGRVVTKMEFDLDSSAPRLLFTPVAAVSSEDQDTVQQQTKSEAALNAIAMTVYESDTRGGKVAAQEEGEAPAQPSEEDIPEPKVRGAETETAVPTDVADVVSKWSKKK